MKTKVSTKWIQIGLLAIIAVLLVVLIIVLDKPSLPPDPKPMPEPLPDEYVTDEDVESTESWDVQEDYVSESESSAVSSSPDHKWKGLMGPVKTVRETKVSTDAYGYQDTNHNTLNFDRSGRFQPEHPGQVTYTRDGAGRVTKEVEIEYIEGRKYTYVSAFKYNDQGYVKYESIQFKPDLGDTYIDYYNYTLNSKGWPTSAKVKSQGDGDDTNSRFTYTYSDIDQYGNWRKAVIKQKLIEENETATLVITRTINYWD